MVQKVMVAWLPENTKPPPLPEAVLYAIVLLVITSVFLPSLKLSKMPPPRIVFGSGLGGIPATQWPTLLFETVLSISVSVTALAMPPPDWHAVLCNIVPLVMVATALPPPL